MQEQPRRAFLRLSRGLFLLAAIFLLAACTGGGRSRDARAPTIPTSSAATGSVSLGTSGASSTVQSGDSASGATDEDVAALKAEVENLRRRFEQTELRSTRPTHPMPRPRRPEGPPARCQALRPARGF